MGHWRAGLFPPPPVLLSFHSSLTYAPGWPNAWLGTAMPPASLLRLGWAALPSPASRQRAALGRAPSQGPPSPTPGLSLGLTLGSLLVPAHSQSRFQAWVSNWGLFLVTP